MNSNAGISRNIGINACSKAAVQRLSSLTVLIALPLFGLAAQSDDLRPISPDLATLEGYATCSAKAEVRLLPQAESWTCSQLYLSLKLSLLPDVTLVRYRSMTAPDRAIANLRGYSAYRSWLSDNPENQIARASGGS